MTHTPGLWKTAKPTFESSDMGVVGHIDGQAYLIIECFGTVGQNVEVDAAANAALIAAAPDLLAACNKAIVLLGIIGGSREMALRLKLHGLPAEYANDTTLELREAVARAEGRMP
jgi:hypothetical protein